MVFRTASLLRGGLVYTDMLKVKIVVVGPCEVRFVLKIILNFLLNLDAYHSLFMSVRVPFKISGAVASTKIIHINSIVSRLILKIFCFRVEKPRSVIFCRMQLKRSVATTIQLAAFE